MRPNGTTQSPAKTAGISLAALAFGLLLPTLPAAQQTGPVGLPVESGEAVGSAGGGSLVFHDAEDASASTPVETSGAAKAGGEVVATPGALVAAGEPAKGAGTTVIVVERLVMPDLNDGAFGLGRYGVGAGARAGLGLGAPIRIAPGITDRHQKHACDGYGHDGRWDRRDARHDDVYTAHRDLSGHADARIAAGRGYGACLR